FGPEHPDSRRDVNDVGIGWVEHELIDDRDVFLEAAVVRSPALAAVRALVHGIPHGAGQDIRRAVGVLAECEDAKTAQVRGHVAPGGSAVAGLVEGFVGGHIQDVRVPRMRRDGHNGVTLLSTGYDRKQEAEQNHGTYRKGHEVSPGMLVRASYPTGVHRWVSSVPPWLTAAFAAARRSRQNGSMFRRKRAQGCRRAGGSGRPSAR